MKKIRELYEYREMIFALVRRELRGRYKGSVLGFFWTFLNPLLQLIVYTLVFSTIMRTGIDQYYLFLFVALVPWLFFSTALVSGSLCIFGNSDMITKIYFPREVLPIANVISGFINMIFSYIVVFAVLIVTGFGINIQAILFLPVVMLNELLLTLGMVFVFSGTTVYIRDLNYILTIVTMAWQFLTPVMYSSDMVPDNLMPIFNINPMTSIINIYRDILYYKTTPDMGSLFNSFFVGLISLIVGWLIFQKIQKGFAEEL